MTIISKGLELRSHTYHFAVALPTLNFTSTIAKLNDNDKLFQKIYIFVTHLASYSTSKCLFLGLLLLTYQTQLLP
ncbi:MAG: hypothetical protein RM338_34165 [Nostoc sp. DedQUE12a]|nr:hypothetical protein [Nostoc sp. DedQUE12a]